MELSNAVTASHPEFQETPMSTLSVRRRPRSLFPEATYDKGILTVSVGVSAAKPAERRVQVRSAESTAP
ncbi:hypothetical protein A5696_16860 [Mycobacterium sp. E2699]|nr:hypothetical protein A5696_16860 [Mycobacterium sp. E2699]OBI48847.1 hypothetical protein A5705_14675 [Mycobacterium sp. E787]